MGVVVPPQEVERLSRHIGSRFDFPTLDVVLYKASGDSIIHAIANPDWPMEKTARACIEATERRGTVRDFLYFLLEARREDAAFRDFVAGIVPDVAAARPAMRAAVDAVVADLYRARALMADPAVRDAVARSRDTLSTLARAVASLKAFKTLHDALYQIQIRRLVGLRRDARRVAEDPDCLGRVQEFHAEVRHAQAAAAEALDMFPADEAARHYEADWIERLGLFAANLQEALDRADVPRTMMALGVILNIVEHEPSRINGKIFAIARQLPLGHLLSALQEIDAAATSGDRRVEEGIAALEALQSSLTARVVEHNLWQLADDQLSQIDDLSLLPPEQRLSDFVLLWPLVRGQIQALALSNAGADWTRKIREYAEKVDDELTRVEGLLAHDGAAPPAGNPSARLETMFRTFRTEVRWLFFLVDRALKADCDALVEIGAPIEALVGELADG